MHQRVDHVLGLVLLLGRQHVEERLPRGLGDSVFAGAAHDAEGDERGEPGRERERDEADDRHDGHRAQHEGRAEPADQRAEREHLHRKCQHVHRDIDQCKEARALRTVGDRRRHQRGLLEVEECRQQRIGEQEQADAEQVGRAHDVGQPGPDAAADRCFLRGSGRAGSCRPVAQPRDGEHRDEQEARRHEQHPFRADQHHEQRRERRPRERPGGPAGGNEAVQALRLRGVEQVGHQAPEHADGEQVEHRDPDEEGAGDET